MWRTNGSSLTDEPLGVSRLPVACARRSAPFVNPSLSLFDTDVGVRSTDVVGQLLSWKSVDHTSRDNGFMCAPRPFPNHFLAI